LHDIVSLLSGAYATLEFDNNKSAALHLISLAKDYSEDVKETVDQMNAIHLQGKQQTNADDAPAKTKATRRTKTAA
jgi:hypothetical protein